MKVLWKSISKNSIQIGCINSTHDLSVYYKKQNIYVIITRSIELVYLTSMFNTFSFHVSIPKVDSSRRTNKKLDVHSFKINLVCAISQIN